MKVLAVDMLYKGEFVPLETPFAVALNSKHTPAVRATPKKSLC